MRGERLTRSREPCKSCPFKHGVMSMNCGRTGVWVPGMRPALRDISPSVTAIGDVSRESPSRGRSHLRVGFRLLTVIERIGAVGAPGRHHRLTCRYRRQCRHAQGTADTTEIICDLAFSGDASAPRRRTHPAPDDAATV